MQQYTALIMDIADSKKLTTEERNQLQKQLVCLNQVLNSAFSELLAKDVDFSGGDEVQGLFYDPLGAYLYCRLLEIHMLPHQIRGGIGTGAWDVKVPSKGSAAQDGPAYHIARKAIELARSSKTQSLCIASPGVSQIDLNLLINAAITLRIGLSAGQLNVLRMMEIMYPFNFSGMIKTQQLGQLLTSAGSKNNYSDSMNVDLVRNLDIMPEEKIIIRNMVTDLANYAGSSVQNISKHILNGNLFTIRSIDYYVACKLLERKDERGT